jgi:hypothetical protein
MLVKTNCPHCHAECNAETQNFFHYLFGGKYDGIGCFPLVVIIVLGLLSGGTIAFAIIVVWAVSYGTKYFCVECGGEISASDVVL